MMFSSLLFTVMCYVLLVGNVYGINLSSSSTTESQVEAAYMISDSKANSEYNSLTASATAKSTLLCANGPYYRYYYKPGYFYWPPIRIRLCDGLVCAQHFRKCVARRIRVIYRWAIVFKCTQHRCYFHGIKFLRLIEHLSCKCAECKDDSDCTWPKKCNQNTWTCQCPVIGLCPHGQIWDHNQCKCVPCQRHSCPPGYYFDYGICDCKSFDRPTIAVP